MNFINFLQKIFGNKSQRDMKLIQPIVEKVKAESPAIAQLTNDELRDRTQQLQAQIKASATDLEEQIATLKGKIASTPIEDRIDLFAQIDKLETEVLERYEEVLKEILPVTFAIVKETGKRFSENDTVEVTATDFDKELALTHDFVTIEGNKAIYQTHWMAGGNDVDWKMVHYDVQLFGGVVLHQGKVAEMATGEGKTLVATLPVFLNALTRNGVHVVTVNDYLAKRDSEWMGPLYMFHGLSVDCIDKHQPNSDARRKAYMADITFGTNNEFGFDYLRDNMAMSPTDLVQRRHNYAIVDEVDSVLIDDARTPLIISGPVSRGDVQMYDEYKPLVESLVEQQRKLATSLLSEAKTLIASDDKEKQQDGYLKLFRCYKALPKNKPLIKYLSEPGIKAGLLATEEIYMENNNKRMPEAVEPLYFVVEEKMNSVDLTDKGHVWLAQQVQNEQLFVLPDIAGILSELEGNKELSEDVKLQRKDKALADYGVQSDRVHTIQQLLKAYAMFNKDDEYVVMDGQVKIVDEQTGRIMDGRRWSDGLHQAVEAKENVKVEAATQTFATITLQNYFRMYHKLSGMTGTASTEAGELWNIYKLDVVEIPTNRPIQRNDMNDRVYRTQREKYNAVIDEIELLRTSGRPVLVGTTSVEVSELLGRMLDFRHIPHQILNAKLHQQEAQVVADAGKSVMGNAYVCSDQRTFSDKQMAERYQRNLNKTTGAEGKVEEKETMLGAVTIATNMAGRGTDIKLSDEVKAAGGLAIIGTERHESRRVDRQLRGRAGRQGDPGSSIFFVSLEDKLMRLFASERISKVLDRLGFKDGEMLEHKMINNSIERAQKKVEENNFGIRKRLLEYDDVMNKQRTVIYEKRRHALMGERIGVDISNMIWDRCINVIESDTFATCRELFLDIMAMDVPFTEDEWTSMKREDLYEKAFQAAISNFNRRTDRLAEVAMPVIKQIYENQSDMYENILIPITDGRLIYNIRTNLKEAYETEAKAVISEFEKAILLHNIDDCWKENLRGLDDLKKSVQNASYEQKDPLLIFKLESVKLFDAMVNDINNNSISTLTRCQIPVQAPEQPQEGTPDELPQAPKFDDSQKGIDPLSDPDMEAARQQDTRNNAEAGQEPLKKKDLPGRNEPCYCGSGKKFKNCHGKGL